MPNTPEQFKKIAESAELYDQSEKVGAKFSLHIDQVGELDAEIRDVLNGLSDSRDFSSHIAERLEINRTMAGEITKEVNEQIFKSVRESLRSQANSAIQDNSSLERAGGFEIVEHDTPANGEESAMNANIRGFSAFSSGDKADMVADVENPTPGPRRTEQWNAGPAKNPMTEPLVDQLLRGATATPERKVDVTAPTQPVVQPPKNLPIDQDPYKEPIK